MPHHAPATRSGSARALRCRLLPAVAAAGLAAAAAPAQPCPQEWTQVGNGLGATVFNLAVYNGELYLGGQFTNEVGGAAFALSRVAKWDGSAFAPVGPGLSGFIRDFAVHDGLLYAGGNFTHIGASTSTGEPASRIARWDGETWSPLTGEVINNQIMSLCVYDGQLHAAGIFTTIGGQVFNRIARWDGEAWHPLAALGGQNGTTGTIYATAVWDDGDGEALFVGGTFQSAGDSDASNVARWSGASWSRLGGGTNGIVNSMAVFDDGGGGGPALYVGGSFTMAGTTPVTSIAKWDGATWSAVGTLAGQFTSFNVYALTVYDDGSGPALYAGGTFTQADGQTTLRVAKWNGVSWSPVGSGIASSGQVNAFAVYDDGQGDIPALYVGGAFNNGSGGPGNYIARWGCPATGACPADWNSDGLVNSADITAFLTSWLASVQDGTLEADFNHDQLVNSADITAFLSAWLTAVQHGC